MSRNPLPEEWAELARKAGVRDSMNGIAEAIGKPASTISRMIGRTSVPTPETVGQVAQLLRVEPQVIWGLIGRGGREGLGRWNPPEGAHELDGDTRDVLNRLIRVLAKGEQGWSATGGSEDSNGSPAPTTGVRAPRTLRPVAAALRDDMAEKIPADVAGALEALESATEQTETADNAYGVVTAWIKRRRLSLIPDELDKAVRRYDKLTNPASVKSAARKPKPKNG